MSVPPVPPPAPVAADASTALLAAQAAVLARDTQALLAALSAVQDSCAERIAHTAAVLTACSRCRALPASCSAFYCRDEAHPLPAAAYAMISDDLRSSGSRVHETVACPTCGTRYRYDTDYEYLVNGTEDEEFLNRLAVDELIAELRRQLQPTPRWREIAVTVQRLGFALE